MAALLVAMSVMAILITAAMPVWSRVSQREKEEELVFRGEQYARAVGLFQRKFANAAPPSIDVLVDQKFLRKKYKDPITNDEFVPLGQAQAAAAAAGVGAAAPAPGGGVPAPGSQTGGIIGVTSRSTQESIRLYKGRNHYNEWQFVYTPPAAAPGQTTGPQPAGQRGSGPDVTSGGRGAGPGIRGGGPGAGRGGPGRTGGPGARGIGQ